MLRIERHSGPQLLTYTDDLARLRIRVFRDWPYLYDGDMAYESRYLKTYVEAPGSVVVLAWDGDAIVGASTGIPLVEETEEVRAPFERAGHTLEDIFYLGESVLLPQYRGQGAGVAFFEHREDHARSLGGFKATCFCGVQRPDDHPARPADYMPLDAFWQHRGYRKQPVLSTCFSWKEIGESAESPKPMTFWMKSLD
ncbi:GNAT family N-acetyltransferase [Nitrogeniibacter aestuarii]|uniref:GNAT family N-acetyltransferase n=1 Tax=Nitrogeniibacter aestuarii TaxID=2815343 RepID=UPI001E511D46|nr:GNAT family N-acetyltransferase [Nitrogeniibacter aestuarii]